MPQVFISHKHSDSDFAENLANKLKAAGFEGWIDNEGIPSGEDWRQSIDDAIRSSFALIVIMTPEAKASEYVTYEWAFAIGIGITVIPVMLKNTDPHPRLETLQFLDFTNRNTRPWDKLVRRLKEVRKGPTSTQGTLPEESVVATIVSPTSNSSAQQAHTDVDTRLLEKLWPLINGRYVADLADNLSYGFGTISSDAYDSHLRAYSDLRKRAEYHFLSPHLETAFLEFDNALMILWINLPLPTVDSSGVRQIEVAKERKVETELNAILEKHAKLVRVMASIKPNFDPTNYSA